MEVNTIANSTLDPDFESSAQLEQIFVELQRLDHQIAKDQAEIQALKTENQSAGVELQAALADLRVAVESYVGQVN